MKTFDSLWVDLLQDVPNVVLEVPVGIIGLELAYIADLQDVVPTLIQLRVAPIQLFTGDSLAGLHGLEYRTVAKPAPPTFETSPM